MKPSLQYVNLVGVFGLAALCGAQWQANRRLNLKAIDLEKTRQQNAARLADQDKTIKGNMADLDDFRQRVTLSESQLKESRGQLRSITLERDRLAAEQGQYKSALDQWRAAVSQRDDALKQANSQLLGLVAQRNDAVGKFNDLVGKYNSAVKELNGGAAKQ